MSAANLTRAQLVELVQRGVATATTSLVPISTHRGRRQVMAALERKGLLSGFHLTPAGWALVRQVLWARGVTPTPAGAGPEPMLACREALAGVTGLVMHASQAEEVRT